MKRSNNTGEANFNELVVACAQPAHFLRSFIGKLAKHHATDN